MKKVHDIRELKTAIVHDWLIGGGAERVVFTLHQMFPYAPIYTSYSTPQWRSRLNNLVVTGYLQHKPFSTLRKYIPTLRARWFGHLNLSSYDLVISSSGAEAKAVHVSKNAMHINYCHAPTHYYWDRYDQYMSQPGFGIFDPIARIGLWLLVGPMRRWDYKAAQKPNYMIANSTYTQAMIKKYYDRDSVVIHPPVDSRRFAVDPTNRPKRTGFVIAGRQTPYKRFDLAIAACTGLGVPLKVIGNGPDHKRLVSIAGPTITFLTNVSDEQLPRHFQSAEGFIFPGTDDFGITPLEAMAAGTPVIAYAAGGALDYVIENKTGVFFGEPTVVSLINAIKDFDPSQFNDKILVAKARSFSPEIFATNVYGLINNIMIK